MNVELADAIVLVDIADEVFALNLYLERKRSEVSLSSSVPEILAEALFTDFAADVPAPKELVDWLRVIIHHWMRC